MMANERYTFERADPELAFLPAALEIQERPPLPASRWILWSIIAFFTFALLWSCVGRVDIVGVAQGKVVPSGRVKIIQPLEPARVKAIHVADGDWVEAGATLIELESTETRADRQRITAERDALTLDAARLEALLAGTAVEAVSDETAPAIGVSEFLLDPAVLSPEALARAEGYLRQQREEFSAGVAAIDEDVRRNRAARETAERRIARIDDTLPLVTERANSLGELVKRNLAPRTQWLELEEARVTQVRDRDVQQAELAVQDAEHANLKQRRVGLIAQTRGRWLSELTEARTRIASYAEELIKAEERLARRMLTSPVAGTVQQLATHTIGGVVTEAQPLMLIVPADDALRIEAYIPNKDIGFVHAGQPAVIKIETFQFTKYGTLAGEVEHVSNDAIADDHLGLVYRAQVKPERTTMRIDGKLVNLTPGMAVTVEVNMGQRRLIEYVLTPLLRYRDESVRER